MLCRSQVIVQQQGQNPLFRRELLSRSIGFLGMLAAVIQIQGCAGYAEGLPPISDVNAHEYHLGPGDQVRILTFGEEQLTGEFRVSDGGDIALPLVGNIHAAGLTPDQLGDATKDLLVRSKLYKDPSVTVEVISYRPFFILGEVARPGQYPYQPGMTVLTAVAVAGGFTYRAVNDVFSVLRSTGGKATEGRAERQSLVQPGDVITVYERHF